MGVPSKTNEEAIHYEHIFQDSKYRITIKVPITIPCTDDPIELAHRVIQHHNLPIFLEDELGEGLHKFIQEAPCDLNKQKADIFLNEAVKDEDLLQRALLFWEQQDDQVCDLSSDTTECEVPQLYHSLVHSSCGSKLLQLEHQYTREVATLVDKRDDSLHTLHQEQSLEVSEVMSRDCSDSEVNAVTTRHIERSDMNRAKWDSAISALKEQQLRNFRAMIRDGTVAGADDDASEIGDTGDSSPVLEESFTIHLGTQMKQMHNLRLIVSDAMDLCAYSNAVLHGDKLPVQRIQTSMQLYGRNLHGLVLIVDDRVNSYSGIKKEFGGVCSRATELHFPELCDQLESVRETLLPTVREWRDKRGGQTTSNSLQPGDVYVTRHSNLSSVHVVFHIVADDSLRSNNINSRHPVILGIRNILKVSCLCDVTTLSLPLLLSNSLSEDMSVPWCTRRAELVYKCVKGFMMEMTSWGGSEMNTLQFMLPKNISETQFQSMAAMLPSIFRVSNPLVVSSQQNSQDSENW